MSFRIFVINSQHLVQQRKEFFVIDEIVVNIVHNQINLTRLLVKLKQQIESVRCNLSVTLAILLLTPSENLNHIVYTGSVLLLYLYPELFEIIRYRLLFNQQRSRLSNKIQHSLTLTNLSVFTFRLLRSGRVKTFQLNLPDLHLRFIIHKRSRLPLNLLLLLCDLFLNLVLTLLNQPLNQTSIVLLSVNHVLLLSHTHHRSLLLLLQVHNSMQLPVLHSITRSRLLVKRLLRSRKSTRQPTIDVQLVSSNKLVKSKQKCLSSLRLNINNRLILLLANLELLLREN